ncbi:MAG: ferritin-like domain-containing protein [Actinomycetota bacterium]
MTTLSADADAVRARTKLVTLLQLAHSGELAAAYAYAGHWRSVRGEPDRAAIRTIAADEWDHRRKVHRMLLDLGARPAPLRELRMTIVGRTVAAMCFLTGRFIPMYGAGRIERRNVHEYVDAAAFAIAAGQPELVAELLDMAQVEWDHERYFRGQVSGHWQLRLVRLWPALGPRESLRMAGESAG